MCTCYNDLLFFSDSHSLNATHCFCLLNTVPGHSSSQLISLIQIYIIHLIVSQFIISQSVHLAINSALQACLVIPTFNHHISHSDSPPHFHSYTHITKSTPSSLSSLHTVKLTHSTSQIETLKVFRGIEKLLLIRNMV